MNRRPGGQRRTDWEISIGSSLLVLHHRLFPAHRVQDHHLAVRVLGLEIFGRLHCKGFVMAVEAGLPVDRDLELCAWRSVHRAHLTYTGRTTDPDDGGDTLAAYYICEGGAGEASRCTSPCVLAPRCPRIN